MNQQFRPVTEEPFVALWVDDGLRCLRAWAGAQEVSAHVGRSLDALLEAAHARVLSDAIGAALDTLEARSLELGNPAGDASTRSMVLIAPYPPGAAPWRAMVLFCTPTAPRGPAPHPLPNLPPEQLGKALKAARIAVWQWDVDADLITSTGDLWRSDPERPPVRPTAEVFKEIHPADLERVAGATAALHAGEIETLEVEFRPSARPDLWLVSRAVVAERKADGSPRLVLGTHTDISAVKRATEQNLQLQRELDQSSRLESIGQLAGGVAHDFNNLLQLIGLSIEGAAVGLPDDHPSAEDLRAAHEAVTSAGVLAQRLLSFARRGEHRAGRGSLGYLARCSLDLLRRVIPENIRVVAADLPTHAYAIVDAHQLEQVLMNLCANARDAMPQGGTITVSVVPRRVEEREANEERLAGDYWMLTVDDTGPGFEAEVLLHAIEPFFTTKGPQHGTGLGLSVTHGIAVQHGGFLELSTNPMGGARVSVAFPRVDSAEPAPRAAHELQPAAPRRSITRVLLAEDDAELRRSIARVLENGGYQVRAVSSGDEVLSEAREWSPDAVVMDGVMPGLPTRSVVEAVLSVHPGLPIVLATGYSSALFDAAGLGQSVRFLLKPFTGARLLSLLTELGSR